MTDIPEDIEIYFMFDGSLEAAVELIGSVVPVGKIEAGRTLPDAPDSRSFFLTFKQPFEDLNTLRPVLLNSGPVTYVLGIDDAGFNLNLGFVADPSTSRQYDLMLTVAQLIGKQVPCIVLDSDNDTPLYDSRS